MEVKAGVMEAQKGPRWGQTGREGMEAGCTQTKMGGMGDIRYEEGITKTAAQEKKTQGTAEHRRCKDFCKNNTARSETRIITSVSLRKTLVLIICF